LAILFVLERKKKGKYELKQKGGKKERVLEKVTS